MIRKATKKDIFAINKLGDKLHANFTTTFHIETEIDSTIAIVLVSEDSNSINGYLYALDFGDNIDLLSIYVNEESQGKHIGTNLVKYLINNNKDKRITLEVASNNLKAYNLYKKLGFKIVNIRKKYYNNDDAYIMKWGK